MGVGEVDARRGDVHENRVGARARAPASPPSAGERRRPRTPRSRRLAWRGTLSNAHRSAPRPLACSANEPHGCGIDRLRRGQDAFRGAGTDARRSSRALLAGRELLHRGPDGGPGRRRLRRRRVRTAAAARDQHRRHRACVRRQDLLLARPLRLRPQHRPHRRHPARRVRRVRAQAQRGIAPERDPLPGQHPARRPARRPRAVRRRAARGPRLDEPLDRHRPRLARADDPRRGPGLPQRRRGAPVHRGGRTS